MTMNTLPRAVIAQILSDSDTYSVLRHHWGTLIRSSRRHELKATHHLLYLILLGKDWRKAFTCPTNRRKIENGAFWGWVLFRALVALHMPSSEVELLAPFDGLVTPMMLQRIRQIVAIQNVYAYQPEQFSDGQFPFDAYVTPQKDKVVDEKGDPNA
jgi:hypothetical protein